MSVLPDKPSELIRVAIKDLEACEADPEYVPRMNTWHEPYEEVCLVCLSGSVMAQSLGASVTEEYAPDDFRDAGKLLALDEFRRGLWRVGALRMGVELPEHAIDASVMPYWRHPERFKVDLLQAADKFEELGL